MMKIVALIAAVAAVALQAWLLSFAPKLTPFLAFVLADVLMQALTVATLAATLLVVILAFVARGSSALIGLGVIALLIGVAATLWSAMIFLQIFQQSSPPLSVFAPSLAGDLQPLTLGLIAMAVALWARRRPTPAA